MFGYSRNNPVNLIDPDGKMGKIPDLIDPAMQTYGAIQCARYQKMYFEALKKCNRKCDNSLESMARYLDKYSSSGLSFSAANLGCICEKMKLNKKSCIDVFSNCFNMGVNLHVKQPD